MSGPTTTAPDQAQNSQQLATRGATAPAVTEIKTPVRMGVAPKTIEEAWRLATIIAKTDLVPKDYKDKPENVLVAIQYGLELGFPPMQALQSIAVVNGRPSVWGDGFLAVILASAAYREHDEYYLVKGERRDFLLPADLAHDDTTAVCTFWRRDRQNPITATFSIGLAKKAGLWGKQGPWSQYPDRMLKLRARGFSGRDGFADVLRGVRTTEELLDTPIDDLPEIPQRSEPIQPRRASEARAASSPAQPTTAPEPAAALGAAPAPASSADDAGVTIQGLKVVRTSFVRPRESGVEPYYRVETKTATGRDLAFMTRDERTFKEAAGFEGTEHAVTIVCHEEKPHRVIDSLAIYEGAASQGEPDGGLFTE